MGNEYVTIYAVVPSIVYKTKQLTSGAKLIAERITALCNKKGYAWITNKSLANIYGIREDTVSKHNKSLESFGFIKYVYSKNERRSNRTIYLTDNTCLKYNANDRLNDQNKLGHSSGHNIYKNNKKMEYDVDGVMLCDGKRCESTPWNEQEQKELDSILAEFRGDTNE